MRFSRTAPKSFHFTSSPPIIWYIFVQLYYVHVFVEVTSLLMFLLLYFTSIVYVLSSFNRIMIKRGRGKRSF